MISSGQNPSVEPNLPGAGATTTVREVEGWRRGLLFPAHLLLRLWWRSLRFQVDAQSLEILRDRSRPRLFILWHNRIFVAAEIHHRYRRKFPNAALISASGDGAWLAALYRLNGIHAARGSSSRRSLTAVRELLALFRQGHDLCITPDGPRGPCYTMQPGLSLVALKSGCPVVLVAPRFSRARRLRSWDRFFIPMPFSRVTLTAREISAASLQSLSHKDVTNVIQERLLEMTPDL
jgi:lysophospholipid acyltransferase (LPLAT)-like uncharacterized protein